MELKKKRAHALQREKGDLAQSQLLQKKALTGGQRRKGKGVLEVVLQNFGKLGLGSR